MPSDQRHTGRVLIIDDDTILASLYRIKLQAAGFTVDAAESGEAGLMRIAQHRPDVVVLDLMLGDMNGVDVLRMVRRNEATHDLPVVVFSSAFLGGLIDEATREGANKCLNKGNCPPNRLIDELHRILNPDALAGYSPDSAHIFEASAPPSRPSIPAAPPQPPVPPAPATPPPAAQLPTDEVQGGVRRELLEQIDQRVDEAVRVLPKWLVNPRNVQAPYLPALYRAIRAVGASARLAGRNPQAHLAGALEVLLQEAKRSPDKLTASMVEAVSEAVNLLPRLTAAANDPETGFGPAPLIVVVDDSEEARDVIRHALSKANLPSICLGSSEASLQVLGWNRVDLAVLDVEMPGMDGLELAGRMRASTPNGDTPFIFVSGTPNIEDRIARQGLQPAAFVPKPFTAIELAVRALVALYAHRLGRAAEPGG